MPDIRQLFTSPQSILQIFDRDRLICEVLRYENEMIISICAGIAMCVYIVVAMALSPFTDPSVQSLVKPLVGIVSVGVAFVIFGTSYFISRAMYQKKEL